MAHCTVHTKEKNNKYCNLQKCIEYNGNEISKPHDPGQITPLKRINDAHPLAELRS